MTGARSGGRRSSGSRTFCRREVQNRFEIFSPGSADFRTTGGPQIGPLSWRLGQPRFRTYPPRVVVFAPKPQSKTHDLGMAPIIPKSCVLDGGFGAKTAARGECVRGPGWPNLHDRGPISAPELVRRRGPISAHLRVGTKRASDNRDQTFQIGTKRSSDKMSDSPGSTRRRNRAAGIAIRPAGARVYPPLVVTFYPGTFSESRDLGMTSGVLQ